MGLFKLNDSQKEAGIKVSDSLSIRSEKMNNYLADKLANDQELSKQDQHYLNESKIYADVIRRKKALGKSITPDEERTLAAVDGDDTGEVWSQSSINNHQSIKAPHCPNCQSTNIQFLGNNRKSFSVGKAAAGAILTGGVGVLVGFAGKKGKNMWICMNCGNNFEMK